MNINVKLSAEEVNLLMASVANLIHAHRNSRYSASNEKLETLYDKLADAESFQRAAVALSKTMQTSS
jgi:pantothenate kinase